MGISLPQDIIDVYCNTEENINTYHHCERDIKNIPNQLKKLKNFSFEDNLQTAKIFEKMSRSNLSGCSITKTPRNLIDIPQISPAIFSPSAAHRLPGQLILQSEILSSRWKKQDRPILSPTFYSSQLSSNTNREKSSTSIYLEVNTLNTEKLGTRNVQNLFLNKNKSAINKNKIHLPPISANSKDKKIINNNKSIYKRSDTLVPLDSKLCVSSIPICAKNQRQLSKLIDRNNFV